MPKLATAELFRDRRPKPGEILTMEPGGLKGIIPVAGIMPALVPSMVDAGLVALRDFGSKSFSEEIQPAVELADGLAIDENARGHHRARAPISSISGRIRRRRSCRTARFRCPARFPPAEPWRRTLRAMAAAEKKALSAGAGRVAAIDAVRDFFYRGDIAHRIDAFMRANDGLFALRGHGCIQAGT